MFSNSATHLHRMQEASTAMEYLLRGIAASGSVQ
jgi:hypothetical protein